MSLNRVSLLGHVGKAPQFYETAEGEMYVRFSLATQETWKDAQGQKQTRTQWHPVVVFSQGLVEIARKHLFKGAYVFVEGMLHHRKILSDDGQEYPATEVLLKNYHGILRILPTGKTAPSSQGEGQTDEVRHA